MKIPSWISPTFYVAAVYDGVLGVAFLFFAPAIFDWSGIVPPNHFGYVQFPGALLITFAIMFFAVARKPLQNRNLIPFGILLKVSYCCIVFYYWLFSGLPDLWKPWALADLVFFIIFAVAYNVVKPGRSVA